MKDQMVSELRKLTTTRSAFALLAGLLAVVGLGAVAVTTDGEPNLLVPLEGQAFLNVVLSITPIFALLLGIRSFTDEFRFGSIVPTLLASPRRLRVLAAKVVTTAAGGIVLALAATTVAIAVGAPILIGKEWDLTWSVGAMGVVIGRLVLASALWTTIGVGVGLAIRHQVAAVAGSLVWMIAGEGIVGGLLPEVARYFPGSAGFAVVGINASGLLAPVTAAILLGGYALVAVVAGGTLMQRRDIA
jgi:ABC-type transport system involved in multi-copper enzyme maturation permease subunit